MSDVALGVSMTMCAWQVHISLLYETTPFVIDHPHRSPDIAIPFPNMVPIPGLYHQSTCQWNSWLIITRSRLGRNLG